jgi:hypothetical protein
LPGSKGQHESLLRPVAAHKVSQAGFDHAPDADESFPQAVAASLVAGQQFLTFGAALQIEQRTARPFGQSMGHGTHTLGPVGCEGREVLEQHAGATQVAHHQARLIKWTQGGHESEASNPERTPMTSEAC